VLSCLVRNTVQQYACGLLIQYSSRLWLLRPLISPGHTVPSWCHEFGRVTTRHISSGVVQHSNSWINVSSCHLYLANSGKNLKQFQILVRVLVLNKCRRHAESMSNYLVCISCCHMSSLLIEYQKHYVAMSCVASSNDNNSISAQHAPDMQWVFKTPVQHLHEFVLVLFNTSLKLPRNLCELWRLFYEQRTNIGDQLRICYHQYLISRMHSYISCRAIIATRPKIMEMSGGFAWDGTILKKSLLSSILEEV
jgi:hypothetical protein